MCDSVFFFNYFGSIFGTKTTGIIILFKKFDLSTFWIFFENAQNHWSKHKFVTFQVDMFPICRMKYIWSTDFSQFSQKFHLIWRIFTGENLSLSQNRKSAQKGDFMAEKGARMAPKGVNRRILTPFYWIQLTKNY